jgi:hypothetical protein
MHDNKVRLSQDVLEKAEQIASEWGLKNARAAVEAVFRKYCDEYLYGRIVDFEGSAPLARMPSAASYGQALTTLPKGASPSAGQNNEGAQACEALDALDRLLAL